MKRNTSNDRIPLSSITHELTLPSDHPDGERPKIVQEINKFKTDHFDKVLETMASQTHVLVLIDTNRIFDEFINEIVKILKRTKDGYVQHHVFKQDTTGASDWIKAQKNQMKTRVPKEKSNPGQKGVF